MRRQHRHADAPGLVGGAPEPIELRRETALGPCRATVLTEAVTLSGGAVRFRVTETWTVPLDGFGEAQWVTFYDDETAARLAAGVAVRDWRQGTLRSHELAPGGRLRTE